MGKVLVLLQTIFLGLLFYFANYNVVLNDNYFVVSLILIILFGFYSYTSLKKELYSPFVEPVENHKLVTIGAYKYIRHPMYTVFALAGLLLALSNFDLKTGAIFILLLIVLEVTAYKEERLLAEKDSNYREYQRITKKFIPFVY